MKVNIKEKFNQIHSFWDPHIVAELNGQHVKLAKIKGEFVWHAHAQEDEMFFVVKGQLKIAFHDRIEYVNEGEFCVVPRGVEHKPIADDEVLIMLFEPASTRNTGDKQNEFTKNELKRI